MLRSSFVLLYFKAGLQGIQIYNADEIRSFRGFVYIDFRGEVPRLVFAKTLAGAKKNTCMMYDTLYNIFMCARTPDPEAKYRCSFSSS